MDLFDDYRQSTVDRLLPELMAYRGLGPVDELAELVRARDEGQMVALPCKVGKTVYVDGEADYSVKVDDVGVWLQAIEEGEWVTLSDFTADINRGVYRLCEDAEAGKEAQI